MTARAPSTPVAVAGVVALVATCLWLLTQNIIFGDEGFFLVVYDQFLRAPERVASAASAFWLTSVLGSVWLRMVPLPGILAVRLGAALVYLACAALAWRAVRHLELRTAGWSIGLAIGIAIASGYISIEYTVLSALVLVAASVLLLAGVRADGPGLLAAAGVVLGVGIFLRLPNVLLPTLVAAPVVFALIEQASLGRGARRAALVLAGVAAGALAAGGLMVALHHVAYVRQTLADIVRQPQSVHTPSRLLRDAARTVVLCAAHGLAVWALLSATAAMLATAHRWMRVAISVLVVAALVVAHALIPRVEWYYSVLGVVGLTLVMTIAAPEAGPERRRASVLGLWGLALVGVGSASLPWPLLLALWLPLPLTFDAFASGRLRRFPALSPAGAILQSRLLAGALAVVIVTGVVPVIPYLQALFGRPPAVLPHELAATASDPQLRALHTSTPLAKATDELLQELPRIVRPGEHLITSNGIPLVVYLARATPFLGHPYPDLVGVPRLRAYLAAADWTDPWPIWIRAKFMPTPDFEKTRREGSDFGQTRETRQWLAAFLRGRGYRRIWENALFEISMPPPAHAPSRDPPGLE